MHIKRTWSCDFLFEETFSKLEKRIRTRTRFKKNSTNSHKPPSTDGFGRKPNYKKVCANRLIAKQVASLGHKGHPLQFEKRLRPYDYLFSSTHCTCCKPSLQHEPVKGNRHSSVMNLPPIQIEVTEHKVEQKECPIAFYPRIPVSLLLSLILYNMVRYKKTWFLI